jgi:hypothetical protein
LKLSSSSLLLGGLGLRPKLVVLAAIVQCRSWNLNFPLRHYNFKFANADRYPNSNNLHSTFNLAMQMIPSVEFLSCTPRSILQCRSSKCPIPWLHSTFFSHWCP